MLLLRKPSIIIADDFHMLCPKEKDAHSQCISRMMSYLIEKHSVSIGYLHVKVLTSILYK